MMMMLIMCVVVVVVFPVLNISDISRSRWKNAGWQEVENVVRKGVDRVGRRKAW